MDAYEEHASPQQIIRAVSRLLEGGGIGVLITIISGSENVGAKLLVEQSGEVTGSLDNADLRNAAISQAKLFLDSRQEAKTIAVQEFAPQLQSDELLLFEWIRPEPRMVICGAGHVGAALATISALTGYHVTLIDDRSEFLKREKFPQPNVELLVAENWTDAVRKAIGDGHGVAVAVVTRGHNEDEECMRAVVPVNPDYVGLIGSKRRTTIVIDRLRGAGATPEQLQKIHAPIGLDIGAVSPEEVAIAILAEVICERRGGKGGSLSAWRRARS
ncbi:MAG: hypothetical protein C5B55_01995 [Blastocatellia bacterium]|nr:MAG: hypothetical protein C5B55_01995 [Blastocatellia bacterium]